MPGGIVIADSIAAVAATPNRLIPYTRRNVSSRLAGWWRADEGITIATGVSVWADLCGAEHHLLQATPAKQLAFSAVGGPVGGPCVTSTAASSQVMSAAFLAPAPGLHVFVVAKWTDVFAAQSSLFDGNNSNTCRVFRGGAANESFFYSSAQLNIANVTQTSWRIHEARNAGADSAIGLDGTVTAGALPTTAIDAGGFTIGAIGGGGGDFASASYCEALYFRGILTARERATVIAYLKGEYGL